MVGITITFGDIAENHSGMVKYGEERDGYSYEEMIKIYNDLKNRNFNVKFVELHKLLPDYDNENRASLIIIKNALNTIFNQNVNEKFFQEHVNLNYDKKYFDVRRNKVLNKRARYNLIYNDFSGEPDYENRIGRVICFKNTPLLNELRKKLHLYFTDKAKNLIAESNKYYDMTKTYIGLHGDAERNITIGLRLGTTFDIAFQWFYKNKKIGNPFIATLEPGDMYIMSEKTVGKDWRKSFKKTLRHCAGSNKKVLEILRKMNSAPAKRVAKSS